MIKTSIIIVAYHDMQSVVTCLSSLPANPDTEIIVIDNSVHNRGFGAACNQAAAIARGKYLFFLNPDCIYQSGNISDWISQLTGPDVPGILGAQLLTASGQPYLSYSQQPTRVSAPVVYSFLNQWFTHSALVARHWFNHRAASVPVSVGIVSGAALAITSRLFSDIGGFDEQFFLYWEEVDLCRRVLAKNLSIMYDPSLKFIHIGETSTHTNKAAAKNWFKESRYKFFKKYFGMVYALGLETLLTLTEEWRLITLLVIILTAGFGYFQFGFWLSWAAVPALWFWLGLCSVVVYSATAKEVWSISNLKQHILMVVTGLVMFVTAPFQWLIAGPFSLAWMVQDLYRPWQKYRNRTHWVWTAVSLIVGAVLLASVRYYRPQLTLYRWHQIVNVAALPFNHRPSIYCLGCNQLDIRMASLVTRILASADSAPVIIALPPYAHTNFLDAITTANGNVSIVWPIKK